MIGGEIDEGDLHGRGTVGKLGRRAGVTEVRPLNSVHERLIVDHNLLCLRVKSVAKAV